MRGNIALILSVLVIHIGYSRPKTIISGLGSLGSVQTITFSEEVSAAGGEECSELLSIESVAKLGVGSACSLTTTTTLEIKYGSEIVYGVGEVLIDIRGEGFLGEVEGTFGRPNLPLFEISLDQTSTAYADYIATISIGGINTNYQGGMKYDWVYATSPNGNKPDLKMVTTNFDFKYWEMTPGEYKIRIQMTDPQNTHFLYLLDTNTFNVQESCGVTCQSVTWTLNHDPGHCTTDCVDNYGEFDTFQFTTLGETPPYYLTAKYLPGSRGGVSLTINPENNNGLNSAGCGESVRFPYIVVDEEAPEIQFSTADLTLSVSLESNSLELDLADVGFTETWVVDGGVSCDSSLDSCTISAGVLSVGGPYQFKTELKLLCQDVPDVWSQVAFKPFFYSPDIAVKTIGSVQTITFATDVGPAVLDADSCSDLLTTPSVSHLGNSPFCSLTTLRTLQIKYGMDITPGEQTLSLKSTGFSGGSVSGEFPRPSTLPKFEIIVDNTKTAYQDYTATMTVGKVVTNEQEDMIFAWTYQSSPGGSQPDLRRVRMTYEFEYWMMSPGAYKIRVEMTDPNNIYYKYQEESNWFFVTESCSTDDCTRVIWTFTNDPGTCTNDCITGFGDDDIFYFESIGSAEPYTVNAVYLPGSKGGNDLQLISPKYNNLHTVKCGAAIKFPSLLVNQFAPEIQSSSSELTLSVTVTDNGLNLNTNFSELWTQPVGFSSCSNGLDSCTIPAGEVEIGGPYSFEVQLKMLCQGDSPDIWSYVTFKQFYYSTNLTVSSIGSVQSIRFSEPVAPALLNADSCPDLLSSDSIGVLGTGAACYLTTDPTLMKIKYGLDASAGHPTITLNTDGFEGDHVLGEFPRPTLPTFDFVIDETTTGYQDFIARLSIGKISRNNQVDMKYTWRYLKFKEGGTKPDISGAINSFTFNYWEMTPGDYQIQVEMTDPGNTHYSHERETLPFAVVDSCLASCDSVTWILTKDPGSCNSECITGYGVEDSFAYESIGSSSPYRVTAIYQAGSIGGNDLSIIPSKYNNLHSVPCGSDVKFPKITVNLDAPEIQAVVAPLTLSGSLSENGLIVGIDFTETWIQEAGAGCTEETHSCTIAPGVITGAGPHVFALQLKLVCKLDSVWSQATFKQFYYSTSMAVASIGSIQTVTFTSNVGAVSGTTCADLLTDTTHLGTSAECSLPDVRTLTIKYGADLEGTDPHTITLNTAGFNPAGTVIGEFSAPTLPSFDFIVDQTAHAYQDFVALLQIGKIHTNNKNDLAYGWTYSTFVDATKPDISSATSSCTLNYLEMSAGEYVIQIEMTDPDNALYSYKVSTALFEVLSSCSANCDAVTWKFTNYPGICTTGCVTGFGGDDTFEFETLGSEPPYSVTAIYHPQSKGGNDLSIVPEKFNNLNSVPCGSEILFPSIVVNEDAPEIQSSAEDLTLSGTLESNSLTLGIDFTETWIVAEGLACDDGSDSCTITAGDISGRGPHTFAIQLKLVCQGGSPDIWSQAAFKQFYYSVTLEAVSVGSIQTLTFVSDVATTDDSCSNLLQAESLQHIGTGAVCALSDPTTLQIKYGAEPTIEHQVLHLRPDGFTGGAVYGTFPIPTLPNFHFTVDDTLTAYQDYVATLTLGNIEKNSQDLMAYAWTYSISPDGATMPDISAAILTFTFNYWSITPGKYEIKVEMTDPDNEYFSRSVKTVGFTVENSCSAACNSVTWTFTKDPGSCSSGCITGGGMGDSFVFESIGDSPPYTVIAIYQAGSVGGNDLSIVSAKYNNLNSVSCGSGVKFPSMVINEDGTPIISSTDPFTLSGTLTHNDLTLNTHFTETWVQSEGASCSDSTDSCTVDGGALNIGGPHTFALQLKMICQGPTATSWSQAAFTIFYYSPTAVGYTSIGSIQLITFAASVTPTAGTECLDMLSLHSQIFLGTDPKCSLLDPTTMQINYGQDLLADDQTISIKTDGFTGGSVIGDFPRPQLPKFNLITDQTETSYQDYTATILIGQIRTNNQPDVFFRWSYQRSPGSKQPDLADVTTSFDFNYWEMDPGEYRIKIEMKDPDNTYFKDQAYSSSFEVLDSCSVNCNVVTWTLYNNPGSCTSDCVSGYDELYDSFEFTITGETAPFSIKATYQPNSRGGRGLNIRADKFNGLHSVECGKDVKFPSVGMNQEAPETKFHLTPLTLSGTLESHTLSLDVDFTENWVQPQDFTACLASTSACTVDAEGLAIGGPYIFKIELKLDCIVDTNIVWTQLSFNPFYYSDKMEVTSHGSVQTITFSQAVTAKAEDSCSHLLMDTTHLGVGAQCALVNNMKYEINYGTGTTPGDQTLSFKATGFEGDAVTGSFARPVLPIFHILLDETTSAYNDFSAQLTIGKIQRNHQEAMDFTWIYSASPTGLKPDLSDASTTFTFNYWEMIPGNYKINIGMSDPLNEIFSYVLETAEFTVFQSCVTNCEIVSWIFTNDPGVCSENCITGYREGDTFIFDSSDANSPAYTITAAYLPGSKGGQELKIISSKFNGLTSVGCGGNLVFPQIIGITDAPEIKSSGSSLTLSGTLSGVDSLTLNEDYSLTWIHPAETICNSGSSDCSIEEEELNVGGPYEYKVEVKMLCQGDNPPVWSEVSFSPFQYSPHMSVTSIGSIQTISFVNPLNMDGGSTCVDLIDHNSLVHLGIGAVCFLTDQHTLLIYYGQVINTSPQLLSLHQVRFSDILLDFGKPKLPSFTLSQDTTQNAYQDYIATITLGNIYLNNQPAITFTWTYLLSGSTKPDISSATTNFIFNYWEMSPADYKIMIQIGDPENSHYTHTIITKVFTVQDSCASNCDSVTWTFTNNPGVCTTGCIKGFGIGDTFEFSTTTDPYKLIARYLPGSKGGNELFIEGVQMKGISSVGCGEDIIFPSVSVENDAPEIQLSSEILTLEGIVEDNSLTSGSDFTESWIKPDGYTETPTGDTFEIGANTLSVGGPYSFALQLKMVCVGAGDIVWDEVPFGPFLYSSTLKVTSVGSTQTITFSTEVAVTNTDSCSDLLTEDSLTHLGVNAQCSLPTTTTMTILYGLGTTSHSRQITLRDAGFNVSITGAFPRPILPKFELIHTSLTAYQDYIAQINVANIITNSHVGLIYTWSYTTSPEGSTALELEGTTAISLVLNYWQMVPGTYAIKVIMTDPDNEHFAYEIENPEFSVLDSCSAECNRVIWTFTNNPGKCTSDCVTGFKPDVDSLSYETIGEQSPYKVTASYLPQSIGGNILSTIPSAYNNLNSVACGAGIKFASIYMWEDAPSLQRSTSSLKLSVSLESNSLSEITDFKLTWTAPPEFLLCTGGISCIIPMGGLGYPGPFSFSTNLRLRCLGISSPASIWSTVNFNPFFYSPTITLYSIGSLQTITFSVPVQPSGGSTCVDLIAEASLHQLGQGAQCSMSSSTTLIIGYGSGITRKPQTIGLNSDGFIETVQGDFPRPSLPSFGVESDTTMNAYQDHMGIIVLGDLLNNNQPAVTYTWSYHKSPGGSQKPNLAGVVDRFTFNYWEMSSGNYQIKILLKDPTNPLFSFEETNTEFSVENSCSAGCDVVTWTFTNDPGTCTEDCVTGFGITDSFDFITTGEASPWSMTATYKSGSKGGNNLRIVPGKFNGLNSVQCGDTLKFPSVVVNQDAHLCQPSGIDITLSGTLTSNSLNLGSNYLETWVQPETITTCLESSSICKLTGGLLDEGGPYIFKIQLKLVCQGNLAVPWSEAIFTQFDYSPTMAVTTLGAITTLTFTTDIEPRAGNQCSDLFQSDSLPHLGLNPQCLFPSTNLLQLKYGQNIQPGDQLITLNQLGIQPCIFDGSFSRPTLPTFQIVADQTISAYQDYIATVTLGNIETNSHSGMSYLWTFEKSPPGITDQFLEGATTSFAFNYWEMIVGEYQIKISMIDPDNTHYSYSMINSEFSVLESCWSDCNKVVWTMKNDPGDCSADCVTGNAENDTFYLETTGTESPYTITATYQPNSRGGNDLSIVPAQYNNFHSASCGGDLKFPYAGVLIDAPEIQPSTAPLTLTGTVSTDLDVEPYKITWAQPEELTICQDDSTTCTIGSGLLDDGGPYTVKMQLILTCMIHPDTSNIPWSQGTFKQFIYSSQMAVNSMGSVQTILFALPISLLGGDTCSHLLTDTSLIHLGTAALCSLPNVNTMLIKYATGARIGSQLISLKLSRFPTLTTGVFSIPKLPTFQILSNTNKDAYQDYAGTITVGIIESNKHNTLRFQWSYQNSPGGIQPDLTGDFTSFQFKYWLMTAGVYRILIKLQDPNNEFYEQHIHSESFTVKESCNANCDAIIWTFEEDPGECESECVENIEAGDSLVYSWNSGPDASLPYTITARYETHSWGGVDLTIIPEKYNGLNSAPCGEALKFPLAKVLIDAPLCQSASIDLTIQSNMTDHYLELDTNYTKSWKSPSGPTCLDTQTWCTINAGELPQGGPYLFELEVKLVCHGAEALPWSSATFTQFDYMPTFTQGITGSIQTLTFTVGVEAREGTACSDILSADSLAHIGEGGECVFPGDSTMELKYGAGIVAGTQTITLKGRGINPCSEGSFPRATLPSFEIASDTSIAAHQDYIATITLGNIQNNGQPDMKYIWSFASLPTNPPYQPDLEGITGAECNFNYWEMSPGDYVVKIDMTEANNQHYSYIVTNSQFTVLDSCSFDCYSVTWTLRNSPGSCSGDCITGFGVDDTFTFSSVSINPPYSITARYQPGSRGGSNLKINPFKYHGLNSAPCGSEVLFPYIEITSNSPEIQGSTEELTLSGAVHASGHSPDKLSTQWQNSVGSIPCSNDLDSCVLPAGSLPLGGPYLYVLKLTMECGGNTLMWWQSAFTQFRYSADLAISSLGAVQTITFTADVEAQGGGTCQDLLTAASVLHLGVDNVCALRNSTTMTIKYGKDTIPGEQILTLRTEGFVGGMDGVSFIRPILPTFQFLSLESITAYRDYTAKISLTNTFRNKQNAMTFSWSYSTAPNNERPDLSAVTGEEFEFNFWEMAMGYYNMKVRMVDPFNDRFRYELTSGWLIVKESCKVECDRITWSFENKPGLCTGGEGCISGMAYGDSITFLADYTSTPYIVSAIYLPGSHGGENLKLVVNMFENLDPAYTVTCGNVLIFPGAEVNNQAPNCQSLSDDLTLSATVKHYGVLNLNSDYTENWVIPAGPTCPPSKDSCSITAGQLAAGGPYTFKFQVKLVCLPGTSPPWSEITFQKFYVSSTIAVSTLGSVQTVTFASPVTASAGTTCAELLTETTHLGGDLAVCSLSTSTTLDIRYGPETTPGEQIISLNDGGFDESVTGDFARPILPIFEFYKVETTTAFQDHSARIELGNILINNQNNMLFTWSKIKLPDNSITIFQTGPSAHSYDLNYWETDPGTYKIKVTLTDPLNVPFIYALETDEFTVENSCITNCQTVSWKFTYDPGELCTSDCLTGFNSELDTFIYTKSGESSPYTVTATYKKESVGGSNLNIVSEKFNNLHNVGCGDDIKFPRVTKTSDAIEIQSSMTPFTLSANLVSQDLVVNEEYSESWIQAEEFRAECASGSSSCEISVQSLPIGGPYEFRVQIKMLCQAEPVIWSEVIFTQFTYIISVGEASTGSVQRISFSEAVSAADGVNCQKLLTEVTHLGTGAVCALTNAVTLVIKYGGDIIAGAQNIVLRSEGFTGGAITGQVLRPILPSFSMIDTTVTTYQDYSATISLTAIQTNNLPNMRYSWTYVTSPVDGIKPDLTEVITTSFDFNYWLMTPGNYKVRVEMVDPGNVHFSYIVNSTEFVVINSCKMECNVVTWIMRSDPGTCVSDCVTGFGETDTFVFDTMGSFSPYYITATYLPKSFGGGNLLIVPEKYNNLHSPLCGGELKFPSVEVDEEAPDIQSSSQALTLSGKIQNNEQILNKDYLTTWEQPAGFSSCSNGSAFCVIEPGMLRNGGPYTFKVQLKLICEGTSPDIWSEYEFKQFYYSATLAASTIGSIQTLTFSNNLEASGDESCEAFLQSTTYIGEGAECSLSGANSMQIKYGSNVVLGVGTRFITLNLGGFTAESGVTGTFARATLPSFQIIENTCNDGYSDHIGSLTIGQFVTNGQPGMSYSWTYVTSPLGSQKPDISSAIDTFTFNYYEMSPGEYSIEITMRDPLNDLYSYNTESPLFTIRESCSVDCTTISWLFTNDPGDCTSECATGLTGGDILDFVTTGTSPPYIVTGTYRSKSKGGVNLDLISSKYNDLVNVPCGEDAKFPSLEVDEDAPNAQSATEDLTLSATLNTNGLTQGIHFLQQWIHPSGPTCDDGSVSCDILAGELPEGGPYAFKLQLQLICLQTSIVWSEVAFKAFTYSSFISASTIGSAQTLTFSTPVFPADGDTCLKLLTETTHLGANAQCSLLDDSTMSIKYGSGIIPGAQTISLKGEGFTDPSISGSFARPILPSFQLIKDETTTAFADYVAVVSIGEIVMNGQENMIFTWSYISKPASLPIPDLTSVSTTFTFNYFQMAPGAYEIKIELTDPLNEHFTYSIQLSEFTVRESCFANCDVVTWSFTNNPGTCSEGCVSGFMDQDEFEFATSGESSPYLVTAKYKPNSQGGQNLNIVSERYNGLHSVPCGGDLKFPIIVKGQDAPEIQSSLVPLTLSGTLITNDQVLDTHFRQTWIQPVGPSCHDGSSSCTINPGFLAEGGPYIFKVQLKLICQGGAAVVWSEFEFKNFYYSSTLSATTVGSLQTLHFTSSVYHINGDECSKLLEDVTHLGTAPKCKLSDDTTLLIKYGADTIAGEQTISLRGLGFTDNTISGSFARPILPSFLITEDTTKDAFQDNIGSITIGEIKKNDQMGMYFEWSYAISPIPPQPDLTSADTTFIFNYWQMSSGAYKIRITMKDPDNEFFAHNVENSEFIVKESCQTNCDTVTWSFEADPGECSSECVTGFGSADTFEFGYSPSTLTTPYLVTARYLPQSLGGKMLTTIQGKYNNLVSVPCGDSLSFPRITVKDDAVAAQSSAMPLTLSGNLGSNGLTLGTDFSEEWVQPSGITICSNGVNICQIEPGSLTDGGPYIFKIQLKLICQSVPEVWSQLNFKEFIYSSVINEPIAKIQGGSESYLTTAPIILYGESSINPTNTDRSSTGLEFLWECFTDKDLTTKECGNLADGTDSNYTIQIGLLTPGDYHIKLTISINNGRITGSTKTIITVQNPNIGPLVKLKGNIIENYANPYIEGRFHIIFKDSEADRTYAAYVWKVEPGIEDTLSSGEYFIIPSKSMDAEKEYLLTCKVTLDGSSEVSTLLLPAKKLTKGKVSVDQSKGTAYDTDFSFTVTDFKAGVGVNLEYSYYFEVEGMNILIPLSEYITQNTYRTKLPVGMEEEEYKVRLIVEVRDMNYMTARASKTVRVHPSEETYDSTFVSTMLSEGNDLTENILQASMMAGLSLLGKGEVEDGYCGFCSPHYGVCSRAVRKCICRSGYASPDCTLTTQQSANNQQIQKLLLDYIDQLLNAQLTPLQLDTILSIAQLLSQGNSMANSPANIKSEEIEQKMIQNLAEGEMDVETSADTLITLISNNLNGIAAENSATEATETDLKGYEARQKSRMDNLKIVIKLLSKTSVGKMRDPISTTNFDLVGMAMAGKSLIGKSIFANNGPIVTLPNSIAGDNPNTILNVVYIHLKLNSHPGNTITPLSDSVDLSISNFESGTPIIKENMEDEVTFEFILKGKKEGMIPGCAYYNENSQNYSKEGVRNISQTEYSILCGSTHLSEFTIIPYEPVVQEVKDTSDDDGDDQKRVGIIVGCCILAIVIIIIIIIVVIYCLRKKVILYIYIYNLEKRRKRGGKSGRGYRKGYGDEERG